MTKATVVTDNTPKKKAFMNRITIEDQEAELQQLEQERQNANNPNISSQSNEEVSEEEAANLSEEEKKWSKRYGDLRAHTQIKDNEHKEELRKLKEKLEQKEEEARVNALDLASEEELEQFADNNPVMQRLVTSLVEKRYKQLTDKFQKDKDEIKAERENAAFETAQAAIRKIHSDYDEIYEGTTEYAKGFRVWLGSRSKKAQDLVYKGEPEDVIDSISLWKQLTKKEDPKPDVFDNRSAAEEVIPTGRVNEPQGSQPKYKESDILNMSDDEFERIAEDFEAARQQGLVDYDISSGAR